MTISGRYLAELDDEVVRVALAALGPREVLLILLPEAEAGVIPRIQALARPHAGKMAGAVFPMLLWGEQLLARGVLLLTLHGAAPPCLIETVGQAGGEGQVVAGLAAYVERYLSPRQEGALCCVFDALVPNIHSLLDACYLELADRVRYFGVNAGSETFQAVPCLFDHARFVQGGLLALLLPEHPGAVLEHGYPQPERLVAATATRDNRIAQIDWRPALDVYRELLAEQYGIELSSDNFYQHAVNFPFGIVRANGELLVRIPVAIDAGALLCIGEIPPNAVLTLLDARSVAEDTPARLLAALNGLTQQPADALLLFYCAGRRLQKGAQGVADELSAFARAGCKAFGALSLGEIGGSASGGYPLFHNATLVGVPCQTR